MHRYRKIYVVENQIGNVKIGVSGNLRQRVKALQNQTGCRICKEYETENCFNPFEIEKEVHKQYQDNKVFGEWFNANYDEVVLILKTIFNEMAKLKDDIPESSADSLMRYFHPEYFEDKE